MVMNQHVKNVVLVHGAFADGSGWEAVANILKNDGYKVSVAQPPRSRTPTTKSTRRPPSTPWAGRWFSWATVMAVAAIYQPAINHTILGCLVITALTTLTCEESGARHRSLPTPIKTCSTAHTAEH